MVLKKALNVVCTYFSKDENATVQLMGSGVILREVIKAAQILRDEYQIHSNVFSVTSFNELCT